LKLALSILLLALSGCALFTRTQTVTPALMTNAITHEVLTNYVTNTLYTVNPAVTNALNNAREIAQAVPTPWGGIAATGFGLLSGALGFIAKAKSDKAALVPTLIAGIETAANNADVKKSIQTVATAAGLEDRLNVHVRDVIRNL